MRAAEETTSSNVFPFKIVHFSKKHRTWLFSAASEAERRKWMRNLRREIDHYNDRKEAHISSDSDSDADSFYGTIERPMDLKHPVETTDDDYVDEDDDEDEEDYLKPDSEVLPTPSGRPIGLPPTYPPPPVPAAVPSRQDTSPNLHKNPSPFVLPHHRVPTSPLPKKPPALHSSPAPQRDLDKGPPRTPPHAPHRQLSPLPTPPPVPSTQKKGLQNRTVSSPIGNLSQELNCVLCKPNVLIPKPTKPGGSFLSVNHVVSAPPSPGLKPPASPTFKPETHSKPPKTKPATAFQRATPDGQSFRSLSDEKPVEIRRKHGMKERWDDSDDDYETVQLPKSVFINSMETSFVEKLFRESEASPQDGLYGIRNSRTKTTRVLVVWDVSINKARNYRLFEEGDSVFLENDVTFPNLPALIEHYYLKPLPQHGSLRLQKPYRNQTS